MLVTKAFGDLITFTRASSKWVPNAVGALTQVTTGVAAIAYDPVTLEKLGFSIEEQRTNLLTYSQDFSNGVWAKSQCAVALGAVLAPDGSPAYKLTETNGASSSKELSRAVTGFAAGSSYALSTYVHASDVGSARNLRLAFNSGSITAGSVSASFDLAAGVVISATNCAALISSLGSGWFRCSIVVAATISTSSTFYITAADSNGSASYVGDGVSGLYVWGAQLETGSFLTSYIPTTSAQATRTADSAIINNLAPWFNPAQGTLFVEAVAPQFLRTDGGSQFVASADDGTPSNFVSLGRTAIGNCRGQARAGGVAQADLINAGNWANGSLGRFALAFDSTGSAISLNGSTVVTGPGFAAPPMTRLRLGVATVDGSSTWNGHIRAIRYFPRRLTNAELQALTTKADPGFTLDFDFGAKSYYMGLA